MSAYPGTTGSTTWVAFIPPTQVLPIGDLPATLFNAETQVAGVASIAIGLGDKDEAFPGTLSVEFFFSGAPGAFELDLQTADTDADAFYQQEGLGMTTVNSFNAGRGEFLQVSANFARILIKALANAVKITARITRN